MALLSYFAGLRRRLWGRNPALPLLPGRDPHTTVDGLRICRVEQMEPRQMLAADLQVGMVYIEQDIGSDTSTDSFELTYSGGAADSRLTSIVIDGDQNQNGLLDQGDIFFDTTGSGLGVSGAYGFQVVSKQGVGTVTVEPGTGVDGSSKLILHFSNFKAGDKLAFSIDVDEMDDLPTGIADPAALTQAQIDAANEGVDSITSGVEFQSTVLRAYFSAPHYFDVDGTATFRNKYDPLLEGRGLNLSPDNIDGKENRTAGTAMPLTQEALPVSIAGTVYLEMNLDLVRDTGETGLAGVTLSLWKKNDQGVYQDTGHTTTTDQAGRYKFDTDLDLKPGTYQVRETQPAGLLSVGAIAGTVAGAAVGAPLAGSRDVLTEIAIPLGDTHAVNYDFAEAQPAGISGYVYHDRDDDGVRDTGEEGLASVQIQVIAVNTIAPQATLTLTTNSSGFYQVTGLAPGAYRIVEPTQPAGLFDGKDTAGKVNGVTIGNPVNPGDRIENVFLGGGKSGTQYNFGELRPVQIQGNVHLTDRFGNCDGDGVQTAPLAGVTVLLLNAQGVQIDQTLTDESGDYHFTGLHPDTYSVVEVTPAGLIDGEEHIGTVGSQAVGKVSATVNDRIDGIVLGSGESAVDYDFCEHLPASLAGFVYHDRDNDGRRDSGEEPIAGVTVRLLDASGALVATTSTASSGAYAFSNLVAGTYSVVEVQPAGYFDGRDTAGTVGGTIVGTATNPGDRVDEVTLHWGDEGVQYNFGELRAVELRGNVHLTDRFGNCDDEGAATTPLAGVTVLLLDAQGVQVAQTQTNQNGDYSFAGLHPGTYSVVEVTPAGLIDGGDHIGTVAGQSVGTSTVNDRIDGIVLGSAQTGVGYDFCEHLPASLIGYVYHDRDNDGVREAGEEGIAGVQVTLRDAQGATVATKTTAADGSYAFTGLAAGTYAVVEGQPDGWLDGRDAAGTVAGTKVGNAVNAGDRIENVSLLWGDEGIEYDFGELKAVAIHGEVHITDRFGNCDDESSSAQPLPGVTILLRDASGQTIAQTLTNAQGQYSFTGLLPGIYSVVEVGPAGYLDGGEHIGTINGVAVGSLDAATNDVIFGIDLQSGNVAVDYDFCEHLPASLSGHVYHDADNNAIRHAQETPIAGVTIELYNEQGTKVATTTTDAAGAYLFTGLAAGTYRVVEIHPAGWLDGQDRAGTINGITVGTAVNPGDEIREITLLWGDETVDHDFGELQTVSISGNVHATDRFGNCDDEGAGSQPLAGVTILLRDAAGATISQATTDQLGRYSFTALPPGTYSVVEVTPEGLIDGGEHVGTVGGNPVGTVTSGAFDVIAGIVLASGQTGVDYDFCEHQPGSIAGFVYHDRDNDGLRETGENGIGGVVVQLLDSAGTVVATQTTAADGSYQFGGLRAGSYMLVEAHPADWVDGKDAAGRINGVVVGAAVNPGDKINDIELLWGDKGTEYNFGELPLGSISGYVFQDGGAIVTLIGAPPDDLHELRDGRRTPDDVPLAGVVLELRTFSGEPILGRDGRPIRTATNGQGFYRFDGLQPGSYAVYEVHPNGYIDGRDTPGTTGGVAINPGDPTAEALLTQLSSDPQFDAIVRIPLMPGQSSTDNDFSEIRVVPFTPPIEPTVDEGLLPPPVALAEVILPLKLARVDVPGPVILLDRSGSVSGYTWHLSVIDAGSPRGDRIAEHTTFHRVGLSLDRLAFSSIELTDGTVTLADGQGNVLRRLTMGRRHARVVTGDFNGDGTSELAFFINGQWYIDLNGNGIWDEGDLWAKLGHDGDLPVTGDWDGDGKIDIGVFGPAWSGDPRAIEAEPGLPDMNNRITGRRKNVPPPEDEAAHGSRYLKLTSRGHVRSDLIDHVFHYGVAGDVPATGDWNGDGVHTIAVFRHGKWHLDVDGDGRWSAADRAVEYGQKDDIPVVGDWTGNGIDRIGVYRRGTWFLDTNGDQQLDAHDRVFQLGEPGDQPITGDWDGDGIDEVGVVHEGAPMEAPAEANE